MYGVRNSSWNPTLFVFPNKNSDLRMKEREILRRRGLMKSHIQTYTLHLMLLSLSMPLFSSLLSVSAVCVCNCSLFCVTAFFFSLVCLPLFIEKLQRGCSLIFLSTDQIMKQFSSIFFPPQLLISCWVVTHYSAFGSFICSVAF